MSRDQNGEHHRTSNVERFETNDKPGRTKDNMFDFVVDGVQKGYAQQAKTK